MGGCSAPNCSNSTTIGKQLFRFPKDPVRTRKWLVNCRRDFVPTPCSRLCQASEKHASIQFCSRQIPRHSSGVLLCNRMCTFVIKLHFHDLQDHFEESQFEEIARSPAGGRKLKPNAIPTLFNVPDPPSPVTPQVVLPVKNESGKVISA